MQVTIGVDPGKNETGIIVRRNDELARAMTVTRLNHPQTDSEYVSDVVSVVREWQHEFRKYEPLIVIEDVEPPSPHMGMIAVGGIIGTAKTFGAVVGAFPESLIVEPMNHGKGPCHLFPLGIRSDKCQKLPLCQCKGKDQNRHMRSAWDIAKFGQKVKRLTGASRAG